MTRSLLSTALAAADAAAAVQQRWIRRLGVDQVGEKAERDFVSHADVEAQRAAIEVVRARFPDHGVLAEEGDAARSRTDRRMLWVIDPIDGTTNFLHGHPMHAASVAVVEGGDPIAGVVVAPATGERWWAIRGGGAFKNGRPMRASSLPGIRTALVGTGFPFKAIHVLDDYLGQLGRVIRGTAGVRRGGAAALDLAYLASGALDAFWEMELAPWDYMAGALLVEEAGGVIRRIGGSPIGLEAGSVLAAGSAKLADELDSLLGNP